MGIFRRAYRAVRSVFRRKRRAPKRRAVTRKRRAVRQTGALTVKKTVALDVINAVGNVTSYGSTSFEINDLPQYSTYFSLYEEYRIDKIVYKFNSLNNMATNGPSIGYATLGMIHTNIDYNDNVPPTSIQDMMNDPSYRATRSNRVHTRIFKPKWLDDVGGVVGVQQKTGWLKTASTTQSIPHYGLKWAMEGGLVPTTGQFSFFVKPIITYYVSFKDPK